MATKKARHRLHQFISNLTSLKRIRLPWYEMLQVKTMIDLTQKYPITENMYKQIKQLPNDTNVIINKVKKSSPYHYDTFETVIDGRYFIPKPRPNKLPRSINARHFTGCQRSYEDNKPASIMTRSHLLASSLVPVLAVNPVNLVWGTVQLNSKYMAQIEDRIREMLFEKRRIFYSVQPMYLNNLDTPLGVYITVCEILRDGDVRKPYQHRVYIANAQLGFTIDFVHHTYMTCDRIKGLPQIVNKNEVGLRSTICQMNRSRNLFLDSYCDYLIDDPETALTCFNNHNIKQSLLPVPQSLFAHNDLLQAQRRLLAFQAYKMLQTKLENIRKEIIDGPYLKIDHLAPELILHTSMSNDHQAAKHIDQVAALYEQSLQMEADFKKFSQQLIDLNIKLKSLEAINRGSHNEQLLKINDQRHDFNMRLVASNNN